MQKAIDETARRRARQAAYNAEHGITPETIKREIRDFLRDPSESDYVTIPILKPGETDTKRINETIDELRSEMLVAAEQLDFERAATLRDRIKGLQGKAPEPAAVRPRSSRNARRRR